MSEFIYVPVPSEQVPAVYRLLAGGDKTPIPLVPDKPANESDPAAIPNSELIRRMYRESYEGHRRLMVLLAEAPDEWIYTKEIATALHVANGTRGVAGMLGAFGRRSKNRYGHRKPWISEWDSGREEARYMMPAEVARVVNTLASDAG
jgi:hypothetical protein